MATTINSGYANSPKLTANIADHADVYGGRALVFDGVSDYMQPNSSIDLGENPTISVWIKPESGNRALMNFGGNKYIYLYSDGTITWNHSNNSGAGTRFDTTNTKFTMNAWNHLVFVKDGTSGYIYVNGQQGVDTYTWASSLSWSGQVFIGSQSATQYFYDGSMADLKFFNSALTEAQVQELYKKPENTPSAVQDNLVAWYPMIEGNPESPQSIVYDHSENKLGNELFSDPSFELSGNNADSEDTAYFTNVPDGIQITGGQMIVTGSGERAIRPFPNPVVKANKTYKIVINVASYSNGSIRINNNGFTIYSALFTPSNIGDNVYYFIPQTDSIINRITVYDTNSESVFTLNSLSIKEVQMGNHATTNFFGNMADLINESNDSEIWDATNNRFSFTTDGWPGYDDATSLVDDTDWVKTTNIDRAKRKSDADHAFLRKSSGTYEFISHPLTLENGKTYNVSGVYSSSSASSINVEVGASAPSSNSDYTHWATQSLTSSGGTINLNFTAQGTTGHLVIELTGSANENAFLEHIAVREVGISSSGFMPVTNEPVVPQVPLMKYNQKMLFSDANYVNCGTLLGDNLSGGLTISLWFNATAMTTNNGLFSFNSGLEITGIFENNKIAFYLNGAKWSESSTLTLGKTYHVVFSLDTSSSANSGIYINGVKDSTGSGTFPSAGDLDLASLPFIIGRYYSDAFSHDGLIDDVSMFNTAFNVTQIQELFNDGVALDATTHSKADDHLLGYWRNDGVTTWTDRGDIQAIGFDAIDDNIDFGNDSSLQPASELTVSAWAYMSNWSSASNTRIISCTQAAGYALALNATVSANNISFFVHNGAYLNPSYALSNLSSGWHHICATYKNKTAKLYIDDSLVDTATNTNNTNITYDSSIKLFAGAEPDASNNTSLFFNGLLGQIAVFNKELISSEISAIYALGRRTDLTTSYSTNLQGYWLLNPTHSNPDLTGTDKILDRSGNGNHGTQNGGVNFLGTNDGSVQGSPDSITIREGLNSNRDGLGFYFKNPSSNVLRLNGSNDFVTIDSTGSLPSGDQSRSITCWIKPSSLSGDQPIIFTGTYSSNQMFTLAFLSANPTKISVWGHSNDNTGTDVLTTDNWWYVGVTYDSGTNTLKSYIGGGANNINPALDINNTSTTDYNTTYGDVRIGRASTQDKYFDGIVDEVKIYNRALSANEILKDFKHQKGKHKND